MSIHIPIPHDKLKKGGGGLLDHLTFGAISKGNAFAEAKNLVLSGELSAARLTEICKGYEVDIAAEFRKEWGTLLEELVYFFAEDGTFDQEERAYVKLYVQLFRIPKEEFEKAYQEGVKRSFKERIAEALSDCKLVTREDERLRMLAKTFALSDDTRVALYRDAASQIFNDRLMRICEDGLISDDEWSGLEQLAKDLRANVANWHEIEQTVKFARERWRVRHGEMRPCPHPGVKLKPKEIAYFVGRAGWYENRKVRTGGISYGGITGRYRIAKGLSFRFGSLSYSAPSVDRLILIGEGTLFLTNQRAILVGDNGDNKSVSWRDVLTVNVNSHNEFELEKGRGKSPVISVLGASFGEPLLAPWYAIRLLNEP